MSAWLAIFRAELRRALQLLPWVALAQVLMFCVRSGIGPVISDRLEFWIEWATWILAGLILVPSIWSDSPSREGRFIATRPVKPLGFHSAKLAGLLVLVALPFVAVEFASLVAVGMSARVVVLGTLQIALFGLVAVVATFPILWLWRGRIAAIIGIAVMPAAILYSMFYLSRHQHRHGDPDWANANQLLYAPVLMLALAAIAVLLGCLLLYRGPFRRVVVLLLYLPLSCLGSCFALWCATRPLVLENPVPAVLAALDLNPSSGGRLAIQPSAPTAERRLSVERNFTRLVVNGRDISPWRVVAPGSWFWGDIQSPPIQAALRERYGKTLKLPPEVFVEYPAAVTWESLDPDTSGKLGLDLAVREVSFRWEVIGDLPLVEGANLQHGDSNWRFELQARADGKGGQRRVPVICHRYPMVWLGSLKEWQPSGAYHFFALLPDGRAWTVDTSRAPGTSRFRSTLREESLDVRLPVEDLGIANPGAEGTEYEAPEGLNPAPDWPQGSRLVIAQAIPVSRQDYTWKSPAPIPAPVSPPMKRKRDPRAGTVMEWLETHPAPAQSSSGDEVSAWLAEFLPRIGETKSDEERQRLFEIVGGLVPSHPDRVNAAPLINDSVFCQADEILDQALASFLTRDAIQRFPELGDVPRILQIYKERGWSADIVQQVAKRIRLGLSTGLADALLADPEAAGFSEKEWLALFRLSSSPEAFRVLRGEFISAPLLDEEADRVIDRYFNLSEQSYYTDLNFILDLALARGREEGPRWLREWVLGWSERARRYPGPGAPTEYVPRGHVLTLLRRNFDLPPSAESSGRPYDWFLAQDPAAFRFNTETRKYQIP